jgi:hypothetical protein
MSVFLNNCITFRYTVSYPSDCVVDFSSILSVEWTFCRFQQLFAFFFVPTTMGDTLAYALPRVAWRAHPELTLVLRTGTVSWKNTRGSNPGGLEVHRNLSKQETGEKGLILFRETLCMEGIKRIIAIKHFKLGKRERKIYTKKKNLLI